MVKMAKMAKMVKMANVAKTVKMVEMVKMGKLVQFVKIAKRVKMEFLTASSVAIGSRCGIYSIFFNFYVAMNLEIYIYKKKKNQSPILFF